FTLSFSSLACIDVDRCANPTRNPTVRSKRLAPHDVPPVGSALWFDEGQLKFKTRPRSREPTPQPNQPVTLLPPQRTRPTRAQRLLRRQAGAGCPMAIAIGDVTARIGHPHRHGT